MSTPTVSVLPTAPPAIPAGQTANVPMPPQNLPETDGEKLDSSWHRDAINLLVELIRFLFLGRTDFFAGGNMFLYYSTRQMRNRDFNGPDVFLVKDVDGSYDRQYWAVWDEDGRYPNLIIELLSPTTAVVDRTTKKDVYERTFHTPEYFLYDPESHTLQGWRLDQHLRYAPIIANEQGRTWSEQLGVWLGTWKGRFQNGIEHVWLRFFTTDGELVPLFAEKAEAELARMKAFLAEKGLTIPDSK